MKNLRIQAKDSNYCASVVTINTHYKHPNADKLTCVVVNGNIVITGRDPDLNAKYVYFPLECQINKSFLSWSNSFTESTLNKDPSVKGFFPNSGRVKAVKLRGQPSMGYLIPVSSLVNYMHYIGALEISDEDFIVGKDFDTIGNTLICTKYAVQSNKGPSFTEKFKTHKVVRHNKVIEGQFRFHQSTEQLGKNIHNIKPDDFITITYKMHGTSTVHSKVLCNRKLTWKDKIAKFFGAKVVETHYDYLYSSRSVIKNGYEYDKKIHNHFYKEDIWGAADRIIRSALRDGITIYAEIVGFTPNGSAIQKGYDYGCRQDQFKIYIYRITYTNASNDVFEFSSQQVEDYCIAHNLDHVPILYEGVASEIFKSQLDYDDSWHENYLNGLKDIFIGGNCTYCVNKVPAEGIVLRVEGSTFRAYKLKSFDFLQRETKELDSGEVDMESQET